jgi:predicted DNA-binding protein
MDELVQGRGSHKPIKRRQCMPGQQVSLSITDETARQIETLTAWMGATEAEVLLYAVERLYQQQRQARAEELEDAEDVQLARQRLERLASGETRTYSAEEVWAEEAAPAP